MPFGHQRGELSPRVTSLWSNSATTLFKLKKKKKIGRKRAGCYLVKRLAKSDLDSGTVYSSV